MSQTDELILMGKVVGTHGIRGELKVSSYSGEYDTLIGLRELLLRAANGEIIAVPVQSAKVHGGKLLVKLRQCNDIDAVKHLVGREVVVHREQFPDLDEGEYYWHDLIGLRVINEDGEELGTLAEIFATGSNDVYLVRNGKREYMIPALDDVVKDVDLETRTMKICPLEGLLDL